MRGGGGVGGQRKTPEETHLNKEHSIYQIKDKHERGLSNVDTGENRLPEE